MGVKVTFLISTLSVLSFCQPDNATSALQALQSMPQCGLTCVLDTIPRSNCSMTNVTCTCTDEWFINTAETCVASSCNITDALIVARTNAEICNRPRRSKRSQMVAVVLLCALAFFANVLRLYARWYLNSKFDVDDWIMLAVAVLSVPFQVIGDCSSFLALGVDAWYVAPDDLTAALQFLYIDETLYLTLLGLTKMSILFFFLRIFPNEKFRICCWAVMAWVAVSSVLFILLQIFQCIPFDAIWRAWTGNYPGQFHCLNINTLVYAAAGCSIAQDVAILALPLPLIARLNTNWRRKAGIMVMFSLGTFVLVMSCIRLRYLIMFARSTNPTWDYFDTTSWSAFEVAVSIIAASLPAIRLYLVRAWPRFFSSAGGARRASAQSSGPRPFEARKWAPLRVPGSSGRTGGSSAGSGTLDGRQGFTSMFMPKTERGDSRNVDVSELELGSVQTEVCSGKSPTGAGGFSPSLPTFEFTGGNGSLGLESRNPSHDSTSPISPGARVNTTTTRTMGDDHT